MANSWLRLWHDMPNDPKWKTIARASGQPIALVQAIYVHLMVSASQNVTRGHVDVTIEDLASALDVTEADVSAVIQAMQGRVLDGSQLAGWDRRQPKREDQQGIDNGAKSAAQRKREQRERERQSMPESEPVTKCHDVSRNVTPDKDKDKDTDKGKTKVKTLDRPAADLPCAVTADPTPEPETRKGRFADWWAVYPKKVGKVPAGKKWKAKQLDAVADLLIADVQHRITSDSQWIGGYIPNPMTYLTQERWQDEISSKHKPLKNNSDALLNFRLNRLG